MVLITHGALAHRGMATIFYSQNLLKDKGCNALAINLSLGLDHRLYLKANNETRSEYESRGLSQFADPARDKTRDVTTRKADLEKQLAACRKHLVPDGLIWVSWPKKAAKVVTDVTEDTVRALALPMGFEDVGVGAVSEVWSGLELVIRRRERKV